jgi:hypothetical protein
MPINRDFVDGEEGFEPPNVGTKNQCLTAWRRPNILKIKIKKVLVAEIGFEPMTFGL